jgi:predicted site-specific integrase-resolvase
MNPLSTVQVAKIVGVNRVTLERWLSSGKLKQPKTVRIGDGEFRQWTATDVERVRKFKEENYRKGRGRKPKPKR